VRFISLLKFNKGREKEITAIILNIWIVYSTWSGRRTIVEKIL
jgi:hypothetical protein